MITITGGSKAVAFCDKYGDMREKLDRFLQRLAEYGVICANAELQQAEYDGTMDCQISWERDGTVMRVIMSGTTAAFVEFGTGITYVDDHPKAAELGAIRGGYGKGRGKSPTGWYYFGAPGTYGRVLRSGKRGPVVHTLGNRANKVLYNTAKDMRNNIERIAREVFEK